MCGIVPNYFVVRFYPVVVAFAVAQSKAKLYTFYFVFKANIGPSSKAVVFKLPSNLTKVQSSTGSDFDITVGSSVNTTVNTFVNMSSQKSVSSVASGVSFETNSTKSAHTRNTTVSSPPWLNQGYIDSVTVQGITYTFGEYYYGTSGVAIGQWRNTSDSTTSNC